MKDFDEWITSTGIDSQIQLLWSVLTEVLIYQTQCAQKVIENILSVIDLCCLQGDWNDLLSYIWFSHVSYHLILFMVFLPC